MIWHVIYDGARELYVEALGNIGVAASYVDGDKTVKRHARKFTTRAEAIAVLRSRLCRCKARAYYVVPVWIEYR